MADTLPRRLQLRYVRLDAAEDLKYLFSPPCVMRCRLISVPMPTINTQDSPFANGGMRCVLPPLERFAGAARQG